MPYVHFIIKNILDRKECETPIGACKTLMCLIHIFMTFVLDLKLFNSPGKYFSHCNYRAALSDKSYPRNQAQCINIVM